MRPMVVRQSWLRLLALAFALGVVACNMPGLAAVATPTLTAIPTSTPAPTPTATPSPLPSPTPLPDFWYTVHPGLELRLTAMTIQQMAVEVLLVRIDPALWTFRVHYEPGQPRRVSEWYAQLGASLVVNGGFFMEDYRTLGLIVSDGQRFGFSFEGHGGMLSIYGNVISLRSLARDPYSPEEPLDQAVQGRPMLLYPGGVPADFELGSDGSRRTAVALDRSGRMVLIAIDFGAVSLYALRDWLASRQDLDLSVALNLDGGGSTGLALAVGDHPYLIDSWTPIPGVIAFYPTRPVSP